MKRAVQGPKRVTPSRRTRIAVRWKTLLTEARAVWLIAMKLFDGIRGVVVVSAKEVFATGADKGPVNVGAWVA